MAFIETVFPERLSWGTSVTTRFKTHIQQTDAGHEVRVSRWATGLRVFDARKSVQSQEDLNELHRFVNATRGSELGFLLKDPTLHATTPHGVILGSGSPAQYQTPVSDNDVFLGFGDGVTTDFQCRIEHTLPHRFGGAAVQRWRPIRKLVADAQAANGSTLLLAVNGTPVTPAEYTIDHTTGIVSFNVAPNLNDSVTAGFQFYVPVRFGSEVDAGIPMTLRAFESADIPSIPIVEIRDEGEMPQDRWPGGSTFRSLTDANPVVLSRLEGLAHGIESTVAIDVNLPNHTELPPGDVSCVVANLNTGGGASFTVKDYLGSVLFTLTAGQVAVCRVIVIDGGHAWLWYKGP